MADSWNPLTPAAYTVNEVVTASKLNQEITDRMTAIQLAMKGDGSTDSDMVHSHKSGTLANRPTAGTAGRLYTDTDMGVTFFDNGTFWSYLSHNSRLAEYYTSDFIGPGTNALTGNGYIFGWSVAFASGNGSASYPEGPQSVITMATSATNGGVIHFSPYGSGVGIFDTSGSPFPLVWGGVVEMDTLTNSDSHWGIVNALSSSRPAAPSSSVMFRRQDGGNIFAVSRDNGGSEQTTDTGIDPGLNSFDHYQFDINAAGTEIKFYINTTLEATHSTVPSTQILHPGFSMRTNSANIRAMQVDAVSWVHKRVG